VPYYCPTEPSPSRWEFPSTEGIDSDLIGVGADLEPGTLLEAYRQGIFPMPLELAEDTPTELAEETPTTLAEDPPTTLAEETPTTLAEDTPTELAEDPTSPYSPSPSEATTLAWWSPNPRGVLFPQDMRQSRSLKRSKRRYRVTVDLEFAAVVEACRAAHPQGSWITDEMQTAYETLHKLGWAHSVETWTFAGGLVGGLYGLTIGQLFVGESMFTIETDASKVALATLAEDMAEEPGSLIDTQWLTTHLASLGATEIARPAYEAKIAELVCGPPLKFFTPLLS